MESYVGELAQYFKTQEFSLLFLAISFLGGVLASLSPCALSTLPIIIGYIGGYSGENNFKTFIQLSSFIIGQSIILTIIGILCALGGKAFVSFGGSYFVIFMASLILVFGLKLIGALDFELPVLIKKIPKGNAHSLFLYPLIVGSVFALAATPCSTPILAGIMGFASLSANLFYAALMLFAFSLGQGLIIIFAGMFTSFVKNLRAVSNISENFLKFMGVILIIASLIIYIKVFAEFF